ncbi:MAG: phage late control D family protein, partial [Burkholderiales bacterium]|nr:phage late control D family protein [Burkholderiales bacterium]
MRQWHVSWQPELATCPFGARLGDLTHTLPARSLWVQYNETDLSFIQRLLAEQGLSWRFEHD